MSDEVEVVIVPDPGIVAVPQPDITVVTEEKVAPVVIESPDIDVVTIDEDVHIIDTIHEMSIVTVGEVGPPGRDGVSVLVPGTNTGDFLRYNAGTGNWEVAPEPIELKGLILTPALSALTTAEGAIYYNSTGKNVQVCTDAV